MLEYWKGGKVAYFAQFRQYSINPVFQYSNSPLVDAFVASMETRKLFVDRPLAAHQPESPTGIGDGRREEHRVEKIEYSPQARDEVAGVFAIHVPF